MENEKTLKNNEIIVLLVVKGVVIGYLATSYQQIMRRMPKKVFVG